MGEVLNKFRTAAENNERRRKGKTILSKQRKTLQPQTEKEKENK